MSNSAFVFLRIGMIAVVLGVSLLSLPLLLRDKTAPGTDAWQSTTEKMDASVVSGPRTDASDIIKELEEAFPSRKAIRPAPFYASQPEPENNGAAAELESDLAVAEPEGGPAHPVTIIIKAQAPAEPRGFSRVEPRPASVTGDLSDQIRKAVLDDLSSGKSVPGPIANAVLAPRQEAGDTAVEEAVEQDVAIDLPVRHPLRQSLYQDLPLAQELALAPAPARQQANGPKLASSNSSPSYLANFWRPSESPSQPAAVRNDTALKVTGPASATASRDSSAPTASLRPTTVAGSVARAPAPKWKAVSCDSDDFWR
jgi:hypothetical protein